MYKKRAKKAEKDLKNVSRQLKKLQGKSNGESEDFLRLKAKAEYFEQEVTHLRLMHRGKDRTVVDLKRQLTATMEQLRAAEHAMRHYQAQLICQTHRVGQAMNAMHGGFAVASVPVRQTPAPSMARSRTQSRAGQKLSPEETQLFGRVSALLRRPVRLAPPDVELEYPGQMFTPRM